MKLLNQIFPLIDYLYIFQLLEYHSIDLLSWFFKYPFKRGLQRKQKIEYTSHIKALLLITFTLIGGLSLLLSAGFASFVLIYWFFNQFAPFFIVVAELLFKPLEIYQRERIVKSAINKRIKLNELVVIAIVGSYAKTSTKNMLYTLLWKDFNVVKTPKSYNTELSIARSILSDLKESTEVFICEMDAYHPREINRLCEIAKPNLGIITAIGPQHLERFGSIEKLAKTQFEIGDYLKSRLNDEITNQSNKDSKIANSRLLFINQQDEWSNKLAGQFADQVAYFNNDSNFVSDRKEYEDYQEFTLHLAGIFPISKATNDKVGTNQTQLKIQLPLKGEHNAINFLAAASIAYSIGVPAKTIQARAPLIQPTDHRLEVRKMGNITILDNTYNANPQAANASLSLLNSYKNSQKILITPGFVELGKSHFKDHEEFGKSAAQVADDVIVVGENAKKPLIRGLEKGGLKKEQLHFAENTNQALNHISYIVKDNDAVVLLENDLPDQYF